RSQQPRHQGGRKAEAGREAETTAAAERRPWRPRRERLMKRFGILFAATTLFAASNETLFLRNVDVYPVTAKEMKGVSILVENRKVAEIGPKLTPPKGAKVIEGKGLRVYPGLIDSATNIGLQEISAVRETVDTGELGDFMPQLRALSSVNPESEHF